MGRVKKGKEIRQNHTIRIEPKVKRVIIRAYGSVQKFVDFHIEQHDYYGPGGFRK